MSGHTYTQDNYSNPRCAHARRGLIIIIIVIIIIIIIINIIIISHSARSITCKRHRPAQNIR